jgi:hypothetical protein
MDNLLINQVLSSENPNPIITIEILSCNVELPPSPEGSKILITHSGYEEEIDYLIKIEYSLRINFLDYLSEIIGKSFNLPPNKSFEDLKEDFKTLYVTRKCDPEEVWDDTLDVIILFIRYADYISMNGNKKLISSVMSKVKKLIKTLEDHHNMLINVLDPTKDKEQLSGYLDCCTKVILKLNALRVLYISMDHSY